jgi:hypothetical protein
MYGLNLERRIFDNILINIHLFCNLEFYFSDLLTASSYSTTGGGTRPINNHNAYRNSLNKQSGSRTEKRPYACTAVVSDIKHTVGVRSTVNLEETQGKRLRNRNKFASFTPATDQNSNSAVDAEGIWPRRTKTKKT